MLEFLKRLFGCKRDSHRISENFHRKEVRVTFTFVSRNPAVTIRSYGHMSATQQNNTQVPFPLIFKDDIGNVIVDKDTLTVTSSDATTGVGQLDSTNDTLYSIGQGKDGDVTYTLTDTVNGVVGTLTVTMQDPTVSSISFGPAGAPEAIGTAIP